MSSVCTLGDLVTAAAAEEPTISQPQLLLGARALVLVLMLVSMDGGEHLVDDEPPTGAW